MPDCHGRWFVLHDQHTHKPILKDRYIYRPRIQNRIRPGNRPLHWMDTWFMLSPPAHVHGGAVDVGPDAAIAWLALNRVWYGLCQIYGNEPWHFEYLPDAVAYGCPPMYPDPIWDPRMNPA